MCSETGGDIDTLQGSCRQPMLQLMNQSDSDRPLAYHTSSRSKKGRELYYISTCFLFRAAFYKLENEIAAMNQYISN
jgi:hypothetical protein